MIHESQLEQAVDVIGVDESGSLNYSSCMQVMCFCLRLVLMDAPQVVTKSLALGCLHWLESRASESDLDAARIECWEFLDGMGEGASLGSREAIAVRAVICVLFPRPQNSDAGYEAIEFFVDLLNMLGDCENEFLRAVGEVF